MLFTKEVESGTSDEQDAEGREGVEINEDPGADDSINPCDGQQKAQRRDDGDGEVSHVLPLFSKVLKEKEKSRSQDKYQNRLFVVC